MPKRLLVHKWDIYSDLEIIEEVNPLIMPSWEKKRRFRCKCHICWNRNYEVLLSHLRRRQITYCDYCSDRRVYTDSELSPDNRRYMI